MQGINKVTFGQYPDSIGYGVIGFRIIATPRPALTTDTIADLILLLKKNRISTLQNVSLEGFESETDEHMLFTLCQTLKDWQYRIRVVSNGMLYHAWYKLADFLVVDIADRMSWGRFKGNQLVFPLSSDDLREPDLPPLDTNTALFFRPMKLDVGDVLTFLQHAKHPWNMYKSVPPAWEITL